MNGATALEITDWDTASDLRGYRCVPANPKAVVLVVHGFGEHAMRHAEAMRAWARHGIACYAYDHRGHGHSPGKRAVVDSLGDLVGDAVRLRTRAVAQHRGLPAFVFGASMGGLIATRSAQRSPAGLSGVVLVAPAFALAENIPSFVQPILRGIRKIAPNLAAAPPLVVAALSRDPSVGEAYAADPLNFHGSVPLCTATELVSGGTAAVAEAPSYLVPTLIFQGDADKILFPVGATRFRDAAAANPDLTLTIVPGGFHELFNDPGGDALIATAGDWILAHAGANATAS